MSHHFACLVTSDSGNFTCVRYIFHAFLVPTLFLGLAITALAQGLKPGRGQLPPAAAPDSAEPQSPPDNALRMTIAQAVEALQEVVPSAYTGSEKLRMRPVEEYTLAAPVVEQATPLALGFRQQAQGKPHDKKLPPPDPVTREKRITFAQETQYQVPIRCVDIEASKPLYCVAESALDFMPYLQWTERDNAQRYADAVNRLIFAAHVDFADPAEMTTFTAAVKTWQGANPRPPLSVAADRERVLAEQAIADKNPQTALGHYESGLALDPMWPEGWFNAAMLYGELKVYALAANRMQHYLTLAPDSSDSRAAYEKTIIWQDEARHSPTGVASTLFDLYAEKGKKRGQI